MKVWEGLFLVFLGFKGVELGILYLVRGGFTSGFEDGLMFMDNFFVFCIAVLSGFLGFCWGVFFVSHSLDYEI